MAQAKLIQKQGPDKGKTYLLSATGVTSIGRLSSNTISLPDKSVSRQHCQVEGRDNTFVLKDLGSKNKTRVNGKNVSEHILKDGDKITIGEYILAFVLSSGKEREISPVPETDETSLLSEDETTQTLIGRVLSEKDAIYNTPMQIKVDAANYERVCRDLSILYDASKVISSEYDLTIMLEKLLDLIFKFMKSGRSVIYLRKEKEDELTQAAVMIREDRKEAEEIRLSRTITERVLKKGESILCTNVAKDSRFKNAESMLILGQRSVICVPLRSGKRIIGLVYLDIMTKDGSFSEADLQLLSALGTQAGGAINNALLYKHLEEQKQLNEDIVENIDEGILVVDLGRCVIFANTRLEELTGYRLQRDSLFGKKISEVFPYLKDLDKNYDDVFNSGEGLTFEGGAIRYTLIPVKSHDGKIQKIVTVLSRI